MLTWSAASLRIELVVADRVMQVQFLDRFAMRFIPSGRVD
jgi:hypothetical protein